MGRTEKRSCSRKGVCGTLVIIVSTGVLGGIVQSSRGFGGVED